MASLTKEQREALSKFEDAQGADTLMGAADTGLSAAMSGASAGMAIGGPAGALIGAAGGLVVGGLIGGFKAYEQNKQLTAAQKSEMKLQNRAQAEQERQTIRDTRRAASDLNRAFKSNPAEISGTAMSPGMSSFDAYKIRNYGG